MVSKIAIALAIALLISAGCLQVRTEQDCQALESYKEPTGGQQTKLGEAMACYHELAVGRAVSNDEPGAIEACNKVGQTGNAFSENEMNNCFGDIAEAMKNPDLCSNIHTGLAENPMKAVWDYDVQACQKNATPLEKPSICGISAIALALPAALLLLAHLGRKEEEPESG